MNIAERPDINDLPLQCDWGDCDLIAINWRWAADPTLWLPVCWRHEESA